MKSANTHNTDLLMDLSDIFSCGKKNKKKAASALLGPRLWFDGRPLRNQSDY